METKDQTANTHSDSFPRCNNPFTIDPDTIFICGPEKNESGAPNELFSRLADKLNSLGYKVFNPRNYPTCENPRAECACMMMCNKVVTLPFWDIDQKCYNQVKIARIMLKEIITSDRFFFNDKFISER